MLPVELGSGESGRFHAWVPAPFAIPSLPILTSQGRVEFVTYSLGTKDNSFLSEDMIAWQDHDLWVGNVFASRSFELPLGPQILSAGWAPEMLPRQVPMAGLCDNSLAGYLL